MQKTITFQNQAQVILMKCEMLGQISDGYWENSTPYDHYKSFSDIDVIAGEQVGKNFYTRRKYNFANKELVDCVGYRMITAVRFFQAFPQINLNEHWDYPKSLELDAVNEWAKNIINPTSASCWVQRSGRVLKNFPGVTTHQELSTVVMCGVSKFPYEMKNLRKDLTAMSKVVNALNT